MPGSALVSSLPHVICIFDSHGGANEAVIRMLVNIGTPANVPAYIEKVKKKESVL